MELNQSHRALAELMTSGCFNFSDELDIITEDEYHRLLALVEPIDYEIAYEQSIGTAATLNIVELAKIDRDELSGRVYQIRKERTWEEMGLRAIELEITEIPSPILITNTLEPIKQLTTTWWITKDGSTVCHYRQLYNGQVLESNGIFGNHMRGTNG